jgi:hypothetical protein
MKAIRNLAWLAAVALGFVAAAPAQAQQQQWAAAYVNWAFPNSPATSTVAQDMQIPQAARASFFTLNLDFTTGEGGYIGLQSDETGAGSVRFSLWNTAVARGDACRTFDGEGEGMTCVLPVSIDPNVVYRVGITRDTADTAGQWWVGWIESPDRARRQIGAIRVPRQHREIASENIHNFSEYWGDAVKACRDTPLSAAIFAAPVLTLANGRGLTGTQPSGTQPEENRCATGRESRGAAVTHMPMALRNAPAIALTLGGAPQANRAMAKSLAAPAPGR